MTDIWNNAPIRTFNLDGATIEIMEIDFDSPTHVFEHSDKVKIITIYMVKRVLDANSTEVNTYFNLIFTLPNINTHNNPDALQLAFNIFRRTPTAAIIRTLDGPEDHHSDYSIGMNTVQYGFDLMFDEETELEKVKFDHEPYCVANINGHLSIICQEGDQQEQGDQVHGLSNYDDFQCVKEPIEYVDGEFDNVSIIYFIKVLFEKTDINEPVTYEIIQQDPKYIYYKFADETIAHIRDALTTLEESYMHSIGLTSRQFVAPFAYLLAYAYCPVAIRRFIREYFIRIRIHEREYSPMFSQ